MYFFLKIYYIKINFIEIISDMYVQNFKIIVALKCDKDHQLGTIRCIIKIQDKVK